MIAHKTKDNRLMRLLLTGFGSGVVSGAAFQFLFLLPRLVPALAGSVRFGSVGLLLLGLLASGAVGALFAVLLGRFCTSWGRSVAAAILCALVWWLLKSIALPFQVNLGLAQLQILLVPVLLSLLAHVGFGLTTGTLVYLFNPDLRR